MTDRDRLEEIKTRREEYFTVSVTPQQYIVLRRDHDWLIRELEAAWEREDARLALDKREWGYD